ncbi:hypothetical protein ABW19_dt0203875 [Dactylella cylindrospora]|nr:hypothetical protein ABW19_dt0203875 [Dactylella cylindrospora]
MIGQAIPNATLLLNSFKECRAPTGNVGKRITGHFLTHVAARYPLDLFADKSPSSGNLQIAAVYLHGVGDTGKQYHIQITALNSPNPDDDAEDAARECPDYAAAATYDQLKDSEEYVVFVCATLGELEENNQESFIKLNDNKDPACNINLQFTLTNNDRRLWDCMDQATYDAIETMCASTGLSGSADPRDFIEYWDANSNSWIKEKPAVDTIRIPGIVHEAATAFVGPENRGGSLDELYRPHGIDNVHVTGAALFPTSGSWNPTLTMCGFAQDLARKLNEPQQNVVPEVRNG